MGNNGKRATKVYTISVRFNEREIMELEKKVSHTSHSKSEFIRRCVLGRKLRTPSQKVFGDDMQKIHNQLKKITGWTKNFYNETQGLDKAITYQILSTINDCGKELLIMLETLHENYQKYDNMRDDEI